MSKMQCKCGASIGTSECPSPYSLAIYYECEIQDALTYDPNIQLRNFLLDWDEKTESPMDFMRRTKKVHYMYCTTCRRVYEVELGPYGKWLRLYNLYDETGEIQSPEECSRIYVFPEVMTDAATEEEPNLLLADYLKHHEIPIYLLSADEKAVYVIDGESDNPKCMYVLEDTQESDR